MPADIAHVQSAVVIKNKHILVLSNGGGGSFPGGKPESKDKTPEDVLRREIDEETGLCLLTRVFFDTFSGRGLSGEHRVVDFHLVELEGELCLSDEHSRFDWFNLWDIPWQQMTEPCQKCLRALIEGGLL